MNPGPIWGVVFLVAAVALIVWDVVSSIAANRSAKKVEEAKAKLDVAVLKLDAANASVTSQIGVFDASQSGVIQQVAAATEEAKDEVTSAKHSLVKAFDTALQEMAKTHSKLVVGAGFIVLAAGAFGAPIPFIGTGVGG